jgi:PhzF family phenazine biosynthesis protein
MVLDEALPEEAMQEVAQEMAQAETAFVVRRDGACDIRWFTPVHEAAFCGHATLASAHVLAAELGMEGEIAFHTRQVGVLRVRPEERGATRWTCPGSTPSRWTWRGSRPWRPAPRGVPQLREPVCRAGLGG